MARLRLTIVFLVAIAIAMGAWAWLAAQRQATVAAKADASITGLAADVGKLCVMTANVRFSDPGDGVNVWVNRRELMVKTLLKYNADIIGCQEVTPAQGAYLIKELGNWYTHYPRAGVGKIEGATGSRAGQLLGEVTATFASLNTLFYRTSRFDQVDGMAGLAVPEEPQGVPSENTFFTLAVLREKSEVRSQKSEFGNQKSDGGDTIIVVDTHIRHHAEFAVKCAMRIRANIGAALKKYPGAAVVMMGDMNHDRMSPVYRALVGSDDVADGAGVLADSFDYTKKRANESWGNWHEFTGVPRQMWPTDLILTNAGWGSEGAQLVRDGGEKGLWPSDHFFVRVELDKRAAGN